MAEFKKCINCGNECPVSNKFCNKCGHPFEIEQTITLNKPLIQEEIKTYKNEEYVAPNKSKAPLIIGIVVASVVVIACVLIFVVLPMFNNSNSSNTTVNGNELLIPNVIGSTQTVAEDMLKEKGMAYKVETIQTNDYEAGIVFEISQSVGSKYDSNNIIVIKVAEAKKEYKVVYVDSTVKVRTTPKVEDDNSNYVGKIVKGETFIVYETVTDSKYIWYRIGDNMWFASDGTWTVERDDQTTYEQIQNAYGFIILNDSVKDMTVYDAKQGNPTSTTLQHYEIHIAYDIDSESNSTWYCIENNCWICDQNNVSVSKIGW